MGHSLPCCLRSKINKARKGFAGDRAVSSSSPGRSRATRHERTHWCCWIRGTDAPGSCRARSSQRLSQCFTIPNTNQSPEDLLPLDCPGQGAQG